MDNLHAVFLALLQGLTEFLPISSSAHLILVPRLLGWEDQGLAFDVAVHVGTLVAVVLVVLIAAGALPMIDIAYQGFGDGLDEGLDELVVPLAPQAPVSNTTFRRKLPTGWPRSASHRVRPQVATCSSACPNGSW